GRARTGAPRQARRGDRGGPRAGGRRPAAGHRVLRRRRRVPGAGDRPAGAPPRAAVARAGGLMPALRKPHGLGGPVPGLVVEGGEAPNAAEAGLLLWVACIEVCQRPPGRAVFDAEATPLVSQDGHFTPHHARPGATPGDSFYGPTRRDELIWLELALPRPGAVRLPPLARHG